MKKISETLAWLGTSYIPSIFSGVVAGAWLIALLVTGNTPGEIFTFSKPLPNLSSANIEVLTASPNPIVVCNASGLGDTTLTWVAEVGSQYEIRKSSPTGELTLATSSSGSRTVTSVPPNTTFFLNKATIVLKYVWRFSRTGGMYREKISQTIWDTVGRVTVLHTQQGCSSAKLSVGVSPATVTVGGSYTLTASSAGAGKQTVPYEGLLDYTERYCPFSSPLSCTTTSGKWGSYKLVSGKVSVNLPTTTAPGVYNFKFRPQGSAGEWSNEIALQVNPTIPVDLPTTNNIDINTIHSITYWDSLGNPSRNSSKWLGCSDTYTAELEAQVVKMRDVGFNAVWMIPWWKCFSNSDVYPNLKLLPEAMSRLRATLDMLKRNNMKAVLSLAYNGALADSARAKWVPSCDILRYRSAEGDPIGYWTIKDFYTQFLTDIQSYSNDVVILYHTEGYICNDRPWDTVSVSEAQLVRDTVGRLPWDLPQELRRKFIIGYHDYLQNISENGAGTVTVTTATMPKSATGQIPYDFRSTGYYEPVSFTGGHYTLSDQEGFNQKLRNYYGQNMKTFYGEFGVGYGGSCFPKDVKALIALSTEYDYDFKLLKAVDEINSEMRKHFVAKIVKHFDGSLKGKKIAILGLAFKPDTDDMREAPSVDIIKELMKKGAAIRTFDPIAMENAKGLLPKDVLYAKDAYEAAKDADAVAVVTEWNEFRQLDLVKLAKGLNSLVLFDGRNIYEPETVKKLGYTYYGVGRM
jgi:hypothetical protein